MINWEITAWKVSVFGVILVRIFPHSDWITPNKDTFYAVDVSHLHSNRIRLYFLKEKCQQFLKNSKLVGSRKQLFWNFWKSSGKRALDLLLKCIWNLVRDQWWSFFVKKRLLAVRYFCKKLSQSYLTVSVDNQKIFDIIFISLWIITMRLLNLPFNLQCAAVRTQCFDKIAPKQKVLLCSALNIAVPFSHWSSTCQGHSPASAKFPPTILSDAVPLLRLIWDFFSSSPGLIPQPNSGLYL